MSVFESIVKALLDSAATGEIAFFLAGILSCLWGLAKYLKFFEKWDEWGDTQKEIKSLLKEVRSIQNNRKIKDRITKGEDITEEF